MPTLHEKLAEDIKFQLKDGYDLVYINQGDKLMDTQVAALVAGDWETLDESIEEWVGDARWDGATYAIKDEVAWVVKDWEEHDYVTQYVNAGVITDWAEGDYDYSTLAADFEMSDPWYGVMDAIQERDTSTPTKDLARATEDVLMRQLIVNEDGGWAFRKVKPKHVVKGFLKWAEEGSTFVLDDHNRKVLRDTLAECSPEFSVLLGMIVYPGDVGVIYDLPYDLEYVDIVNPHIYLGNPFAGSGYCSDDPVHATFRVKRSELTTDKSAFGYGWNDVTGGTYTSSYSGEIKAVPTTKEED